MSRSTALCASPWLTEETLDRTTFCYPDSVLEPEAFGTADRMALIEVAVDGVLTPKVVGDARDRHDQQDLKKVWHLLARFGRA